MDRPPRRDPNFFATPRKQRESSESRLSAPPVRHHSGRHQERRQGVRGAIPAGRATRAIPAERAARAPPGHQERRQGVSTAIRHVIRTQPRLATCIALPIEYSGPCSMAVSTFTPAAAANSP